MNKKPTLSLISKIYGITIKEIKKVVDKHHFATLDDMDIVKIIDAFGSHEEVSNLLSVEEEQVEETIEEETIEITDEELIVESNKPIWCTDIQWLMFDTGVYDMDINPDKE